MKHLKQVVIVLILASGLLVPGASFAAEKPTVVSFRMTPDSIEASIGGDQVSFELVVSNPFGIASQSTYVTLTDGSNNSLNGILTRVDSPINQTLATVTFRGSIQIPSNLPAGVYSATAKPITALNSDGNAGFSTDTLNATSDSKVLGASNSFQVRQSGNLDFNYSTFIGPAYDKSKGYIFKDPKFNTIAAPIWRVGETIDLSKYYEMVVPALGLKVTANTTVVCGASGTMLKLLSTGSCSFTVFTEKNKDYLAYKSEQVASIGLARTKPTLSVSAVATQDSSKLPISIAGPFVYSPLGLINPISATPNVCYPVGTYITVTSGGTCILNYSTPETSEYLASDVYQLKFEITRTAQTMNFVLPKTIALAMKSYSLNATTSSNLPTTYTVNTPATCSVSGSKLNLIKAGNCTVTATQTGGPTIAPVSSTQSISITGVSATAKKLICVSGKKTKVVLSKTCPKGYKPKK